MPFGQQGDGVGARIVPAPGVFRPRVAEPDGQKV
jgi:hypothetical protein